MASRGGRTVRPSRAVSCCCSLRRARKRTQRWHVKSNQQAANTERAQRPSRQRRWYAKGM
jgi:hypothetical protein